MESAAPQAFGADMLNEGRNVIEQRSAKPSGEPGHFDVLHPLDLVPVLSQMLRGGAGEQERLTAEDAVRHHDTGVAFDVPRHEGEVRIVESGECDLSVPEGAPAVKVVTEMPVEIEVILQKQEIISVRVETSAERQQGIVSLALLEVGRRARVNLNQERFAIPIGDSEVLERLVTN